MPPKQFVKKSRKKHIGEIPRPKINIYIRNVAAKCYQAMEGIRRPKTIHTGKGRLYNLIDYLEDEEDVFYLQDISMQSLRNFRSQFLRIHSPLTYNHYIEVVKAFLNWVIREHPEYLKLNPLAGAEKIKGAYTRKPRYFKKSQLTKIYRAIDDANLLAFVELSANVGFRPSQLRFQQWENEDLKNKSLTIAAYLELGFYLKDFELRTIPLNDNAIKSLSSIKRKGPLVFDSGNGRPLFNEWYWNKKFKRTLVKAGIKEGRLYDLRHTFGVHHILAGTSPFVLQKMMGYADKTTTMLYVNLTDTDIRAHAKNIDL